MPIFTNRPHRAALLLTLAGLGGGLPLMAQSLGVSARQSKAPADPNSPLLYRQDSSDEDWSFLGDPSAHADAFGAFKYLPLGPESWYLSFGGSLRSTDEYYRNYNWGKGPQGPDGDYLQRLMGHADVHFGDHLRLFSELDSSLEFGRTGLPTVLAEDKLDFSQLFFELNPLKSGDATDTPLSVRVGRQELNFGVGSLVATRDLNVRRPFDGIKFAFRQDGWRVDLFAVRPVVQQPDLFFSGAPNPNQTFWGIWATKANVMGFVDQLDLYYLGLDRENAVFQQGTADERRHTLGFNAHERVDGVSFFQEGDLQFGTFGSDGLLAWKFVQGMSYSVPEISLSPTFGLQGAVASGDSQKNADLGTFYPIFPKGVYYGYLLFTSGSANIMLVHPSVTLQLSKRLTLDVDCFFLWRESLSDGIYSQAGMFLRPGQTTQSRYIGTIQDLSFGWRLDGHTMVGIIAAYNEVGPYLRETQPPGKNAAYLSSTISYKF